jgi:hypothetical protein
MGIVRLKGNFVGSKRAAPGRRHGIYRWRERLKRAILADTGMPMRLSSSSLPRVVKRTLQLSLPGVCLGCVAGLLTPQGYAQSATAAPTAEFFVAPVIEIPQVSETLATHAAPSLDSSAPNACGDRQVDRQDAAESGRNARNWNRSMLDPFLPGANFGNFSAAQGNGRGSTAAGVGYEHSRTSGYSPEVGNGLSGITDAGGFRYGGHHGNRGAVSAAGDGPTVGTDGLYGGVRLPPLNQLMRRSFITPSKPSTNSFRIANQDPVRIESSFSDLARPNAAAIFTTSDLGNGVFLSAGTNFGRSSAGAPAAGLGSNTSPEGKHFGPSLAIKLSF